MELSNDELVALVGKMTNEREDAAKKAKIENLKNAVRLALVFISGDSEYCYEHKPMVADALKRVLKD